MKDSHLRFSDAASASSDIRLLFSTFVELFTAALHSSSFEIRRVPQRITKGQSCYASLAKDSYIYFFVQSLHNARVACDESKVGSTLSV